VFHALHVEPDRQEVFHIERVDREAGVGEVGILLDLDPRVLVLPRLALREPLVDLGARLEQQAEVVVSGGVDRLVGLREHDELPRIHERNGRRLAEQLGLGEPPTEHRAPEVRDIGPCRLVESTTCERQLHVIEPHRHGRSLAPGSVPCTAVRAVVCKQFGGPDALVVDEVAIPDPGKGQVRIAVRAAGVNYVDGLLAAGRYQVKIPPPFVPGSELAGVVDELGDGVTDLSLGDRVFATLGTGAFAEYVVTRADNVVKLADSFDFGRAASFHQSYCTAWFAFTRRTHIAQGEWVLVTGAGGGIGLAAIDAARALGGRVIAVASTEAKRQLAAEMGAEAAIDPTNEDVKVRARELTGGEGVDIVYDAVGGDIAEAALRATRFDGRFCVIGFTAGIPRVPLNLVLLNNRTIVGVEWGGWVMRNLAANAQLVREVLGAIDDGRLHPIAPDERPLEAAGAAIADLLERRAAGKIVLVP